MKRNYRQAIIIDIVDESPAVKRFYFKFPETEQLDFKPGQFVMIDLPIDSKITNRSYSIASAPGNDNIFELIIVLNPTGIGTPHMWENFQIGDAVPVAGPLGKFTLPEQINNDLCLIATGTGVAPLRSMLHHIINQNIPHKNIYLVFGCRTTQDILYKLEMQELSSKYPYFNFIPVLSRPNEDWTGAHGYVHHVYEQIFADKRPATFYLCGWKNMIMEARERLTAMGYDKSQIKFELYD
jgi:ferredoxin-NADP reductase